MNRTLLLLLFFGITLQSCDKRHCECREDINDSVESQKLFVTIPNAVNENCGNFIISIISDSEVDIAAQSITFRKDGVNFLSSQPLTDFIKRSGYVMSDPIEFSHYEYLLYFPLELFEIDGILISEEMSIDISITDEEDHSLQVSGTTYFYRCEDVTSDFDETDCRWPSQVDRFATWHPSSDCVCQ